MNGLDINIGQSATNINKEKVQKTTTISIDDIIDNPLNKTIYSDTSVDEMIESLKQRELITPIMVTRTDNNKYMLISGHRRCKACRSIFAQSGSITYNGIEYKNTMPAIIHEAFANEDEEKKAIVDANNQREKTIEDKKNEALALYGKLKEMKGQGEFKRGSGEITQVVADQLNVSKNTIKNWVNEDKKPKKEKTAKIGCYLKNNPVLEKLQKFNSYLDLLKLDELTNDEQEEVRNELKKIKNKIENI